MASGRKESKVMLRDFTVDWRAWSRTERWIAIVVAILVLVLFGWDAAMG